MPDLRTRRTAAVGGLLLALRFLVAAVLNYGFGIALIWVLPKADFGVVGVLQNVLLLAAMVLGGGFPWVLARVTARAEATGDDPAPVFRAAMLGNLALAALFVVVLAASGVLAGDSAALLATVAVTVVVMSVNGVLNAGLQGRQRFDAIAVQQTTEVAAKVGLGLGLVVAFRAGVTGVAAGFLVGALAAAALCLRGLRDHLPGRGPAAVRETVAHALPMGLGTTGFGLLLTLDVLALGALGPPAAVIATYQAAAILARTPYYLAEALGDAAFPNIARGSGSAAAHVWFVAAFRWIPLALVPLQLVLLIAPEPVLRFFLPGDYAEAAGLVRLLTLGTLGLMAGSLLFKALYATGFAVAVARRLPVAAALELAVLVVLVPRLGAVGAGVAFAVGSWVATALLARVYLGHHPAGRLRAGQVARYAAALGAMAVALVAARLAPAPVDLLLLPLTLVVYVCVAVRLDVTRQSDLARADAVRTAVRRRLATARRAVADVRWDTVTRAARLQVVGAAAVAFVAATFLWNLSTSPDTQYDEVVYSRAAQQVAQTGDLTWTGQPLFVHPPLSFLAQAAWVAATGRTDAALPAVIGATRALAAVAAVVVVGLLACLTWLLTPAAGRARRYALVAAVIAVAATDPILVRYGRLAIIEPLALVGCLATLLLALALRTRPARVVVPAVGLATGLALLTNEIGIFLLLTPLVHALLGRAWPQARRAGAALAVGVGVWLVFPLWALHLGRLDAFASDKFSTLQRLLGLEQSSGWNRPGASFASAVVEQAGQYGSSYLVLAAGAGALLWLVCHRLGDEGRWLLAWLLTSYGFAAYTVALGTLNEQFFTYVLPAAVVGGVLVVDAAVRRRGRVAVPVVALALVVGLSATSWARSYLPRNDGLVRATAWLAATTPACAAVNASGDGEKYEFLLPGRAVAEYATGPAALSHGVQLFFVSDKDAALRYGNSSPQLVAWVRAHGVRLAAFPSATYRGVELWSVPLDARSPLSGVEPVPGGDVVLRDGSRCSGVAVLDGPDGSFASGWAELGGKAELGAPLTTAWTADGQAHQVFEGGVLTRGRARSGVHPEPVVRAVFDRDPAAYRAAGLPPVGTLASTPPLDVLTDPAIRAWYLGTAPGTDAERLAEGRRRFGLPLGPPATTPDGWVRQAFEAAVLEHPAGGGDVRLAPIGALAVATGAVDPPAVTRVPDPPPPLPREWSAPQSSDVRPFAAYLGGAACLVLLVLAGGALRARRRP